MSKNLIPVLAVLLVLAGCSREKDDWKTAQAADTTDAYQEFMRQHPDSELGVQAQARVKQLSEDRDWQQAAAADTRDAYEQFVAQHADSKWAQEARVRIEKFALADGGAGAEGAGENGAEPAAPAMAPVNAVGGKPGTPNTVIAPAPAKPAAKPAPTQKPVPAQKPVPTQKAVPATPAKTATAATASSATKPGSGSRSIQLGAFSSRERAETQWKTLEGKYAQTLSGLQPSYDAVSSGGRKLYRLRAALSSSARASEVCGELTKRGQSCIVVKP